MLLPVLLSASIFLQFEDFLNYLLLFFCSAVVFVESESILIDLWEFGLREVVPIIKEDGGGVKEGATRDETSKEASHDCQTESDEHSG